MNVLFLSTDYYPANGGVSHVMQYLAEGLATSNGYNVSVLVPLAEGLTRFQNHKGVDIYRFAVKYKRGFRAVGETVEFAQKIRDLKPDAIIVEAAPTVTTEIILPLLKEFPRKVYFHGHDFELLWFKIFQKRETLHDTLANPKNVLIWRRYFKHFFKKYANEFAGLIYISPFCKDYELFDKYTDVEKYFLQNAVDDIFFEDIADSREMQCIAKYCDLKKSKYLIDVSNYNSSKRQLSVMEEFYKSCQEEYALVFVGTNEGEYSKMLRERKKEFDSRFGNREVHILTGIARTDIPVILKEATLYLTASMHEAASVALLETMTVGTPFVSTNVGNARILPGGVVVDDVSDMHNKIDYLLSDLALLKSLEDKGKIYARETCRISSSVDTLHKILTERKN